MKQSLDAARAVDTAYLAKERQNKVWVLIYTLFSESNDKIVL